MSWPIFLFRPITLFLCHLGPVQHLATRRLCHLTWGYLGWCSGGWCVTCVTCHTHHPSQTPLVLPFSTFFNSKLQMEHLDQIFACLESRHIMHQRTYVHTILRSNMYSCVVDSIWLCLDIGLPQHLSGGYSPGISTTTTDCHLPRSRSPQMFHALNPLGCWSPLSIDLSWWLNQVESKTVRKCPVTFTSKRRPFALQCFIAGSICVPSPHSL